MIKLWLVLIHVVSRLKKKDILEIAMKHQSMITKFVCIGKDVWIGAKVVILPGVKVGDHSVISAGSIVNKDVPKFAIAGGVSAKVLKMRN